MMGDGEFHMEEVEDQEQNSPEMECLDDKVKLPEEAETHSNPCLINEIEGVRHKFVQIHEDVKTFNVDEVYNVNGRN